MREIGGYIELDTYHLPMLHEGALALNCGRNALAYLIRARHIRRLWLPRLLCDSVPDVCAREGTEVAWYRVGLDFLPAEEVDLGEDEWFYFVNYYSQFSNDAIEEWVKRYGRVIVDNAQSYFQMPIPGVDTLYTCRKYFGVADGAFLYTDARLEEALPRDESFERMRFLLGRLERGANEFYGEYVQNNRSFAAEPVKRMSALTENLLHGIDYAAVEARRKANFALLRDRLGELNELTPRESTFMYPLLMKDGAEVRKRLQARRIYVPTLWPSERGLALPGQPEYELSQNLLPLPMDQRYGRAEMKAVVEAIRACLA